MVTCSVLRYQVKQLQKLSQAKVKSLLGVSDALAKLNYDRYNATAYMVNCPGHLIMED